jgi:predicted nucleotide-binding protein
VHPLRVAELLSLVRADANGCRSNRRELGTGARCLAPTLWSGGTPSPFERPRSKPRRRHALAYRGAMAAQDPAVFIGSSSEGKDVAEYLQAALDPYCEASVWDQGVFGLSESGLDALVAESQRVDFAVLVLTPDDVTIKRDHEHPSARDNVIFEAGLFAGALGPLRTLLVHAKDLELDLPSDLNGITTCTFRSQRTDQNKLAAVNPAALRIREVMKQLGLRQPDGVIAVGETLKVAAKRGTRDEEQAELDRELDVLTTALEAHGWRIKTRSRSAFRVLSPTDIRFSLPLGSPAETRVALREFAQSLNRAGVRINRTLLIPVGAVPPPGEPAIDKPV